MGAYTENMEAKAWELDPEAADYRERLLEIAGKFRSQRIVLEELMLEKGFSGDITDTDEKYEWLREHFRKEEVEEPRNLKAFLQGTKHFDRDKKTPFQFCFAFGLTLEESETFFRRSYMGRGIDYHTVSDVVYAFCLRNGLTWKTACRLLDRLKGENASSQQSFPDLSDVGHTIYTDEIRKMLTGVSTEEELLRFLTDNRDLFDRNNVTATRFICDLWKQITEPFKGYLVREDQELAVRHEKDKVRRTGKAWSEEAALKYMLGIPGYKGKSSRSLTDILKDNQLLHHLAADCFPNRNGIRSILAGKKVSYESVRKLLILLLFYRFWIRKALGKRAASGLTDAFKAEYGDSERCVAEIDRYLMDAGYPALYYGNPYDWLFLFCMQCEEPLWTIREYMWNLIGDMQDEA